MRRVIFGERKIAAFQNKNLVPSVKHEGANLLVWARFATSRPRRLFTIDGMMNSELHQRVVKENVRTPVSELNHENVSHAARRQP